MAQVLGTGYQRATKTAQILINSVALNWASWQVTITGQDIVTVNFGSYVASPGGGWQEGQTFDEGILGAMSSQQTWGGLWDAHANPLTNPPGLYPRDNLSTIDFVVNRTDTTQFEWPYMRIRAVGARADNVASGAVGFDVQDSKNQGNFTFPTISV